jgi:hypothetical protein
MPSDRTELTREQLHQLIWSKPIHQLAAEFGLSDVGFAKICKRLNVPRPGRGYWAKLGAGKRRRVTPLPPAQPRTLRSIALQRRSAEEQAEVKAAEHREVPVVPIAADLRGAHEVTKKLSRLLEGKPYGDPPMHVLRKPYDTMLRVGPESKRRALLLLDALFTAATSRGHEVRLTESSVGHRHVPDVELRVVVGQQAVAIALIEKSGQKDHVQTAEERVREKRISSTWGPKYDRFATGKLSLNIGEHYHGMRTFSDGKAQRLEDKLGHSVLAIEAAAEQQRIDDERRKTAQQRAEAERQRHEAERRQQEHMVALGDDLLQMAGRRAEAKHVHAFLDAYEQGLPQGERSEAESAWLAWARRFASEQDPLSRLKMVAKRLTP